MWGTVFQVEGTACAGAQCRNEHVTLEDWQGQLSGEWERGSTWDWREGRGPGLIGLVGHGKEFGLYLRGSGGF